MFTMIRLVNGQEALYRAIPFHLLCAAEAAETEIEDCVFRLWGRIGYEVILPTNQILQSCFGPHSHLTASLFIVRLL